jgi:hypothetical protein
MTIDVRKLRVALEGVPREALVELAEVEALRVRAHACQLEDDDYSFVERIITSWIDTRRRAAIHSQYPDSQPRGGAAWPHRTAEPLRAVGAEAAASASAESSR